MKKTNYPLYSSTAKAGEQLSTRNYNYQLPNHRTVNRNSRFILTTLKGILLPILVTLIFMLLLGQNVFAQCTLVCNNQVNVSVSQTCSAEIEPDMILEDLAACDLNLANYIVTVMGPNGVSELPTSPNVTNNEFGMLLTVKVKHWPSQNYCWGSILVEDKMSPILACPANTTVECTQATDPTVTGTPTVTECSDFTLTSFDNTVDNGCNDPIQIITRTWTALDEYGNEGTCSQTISVAKPDPNDIVFPQNYDNNELPALACELVAINPNLTNPSATGWPTINSAPITQGSNSCGIAVDYEDNIIAVCSGTYKILRNWTVLDWCTSTVLNDIQVIKVLDDDGPNLLCPNNQTVGTTSSQNCQATVILPPAQVSDNCSDGWTVSIFTPVGTVNGNGGVIYNVPTGVHNITYSATDDCGNTSTCVMILTVEDDDAPTVICDEFTVASLNSNGMAVIPAQVFDDGSYDNCCMGDFTVRRMVAGCGENTLFAPTAKFCCEDVGQSIMVQMRLDDCNGNSNTCMVEVSVEDNNQPAISCPSDVTLECTQNFNDLNLTGNPTTVGVCQNPNVTYSDNLNLNPCGLGTITRTWTVNDGTGNSMSCQQTIIMKDFSPVIVKFPFDYTAGECTAVEDLDPEDLPVTFDVPTFEDDQCEMMAVNYTDQLFTVAPPACFKIIRTWTVIDWCAYDPSNPQNGGIWTDDQLIIVMDNTAPEVLCPADVIVNTGGCDASVTLPEPIVVDCSDEISINVSSSFGLGYGPFQNVQPGNYGATYSIADGCGNNTPCQVSITVETEALPTPYCVAGLIIELMPVDTDGDGVNDNGMIDIWASDFDAGSFDACGGEVQLSLTPNPNETTLIFTCANVGFNDIQLWVTDEDGNQDFCITTLEVESFNNVCNGFSDNEDLTIAGMIQDEQGNAVEIVELTANEGITQSIMNNANGSYTFGAMELGNDYTVTPSKNMNPLNGVTTYDLVLMQRHILGTSLLDTPYKKIAADINKSGTITTSDVVELKKLILNIYDDFPNNDSWRFVDAGYQFTDNSNNQIEPFPEVYNINNMANNMLNIDFVGVKIGDVNGTAIPGNIVGDGTVNRTTGNLIFQITNQTFEAGEVVKIPFMAKGFEDLAAYQMTLHFDNNKLNYQDFTAATLATLSAADFGLTQVEEGIISTTWTSVKGQARDENEVLFYLNFRTKSAGNLVDALQVNSTKTPAIAYAVDGMPLTIGLTIDEKAIVNTKLQATSQPNPFTDETTLIFDLPENTNTQIRILNTAGQIVWQHAENYAAGRQKIQLQAADFPNEGLYYYQIETRTETVIKKLVLVK